MSSSSYPTRIDGDWVQRRGFFGHDGLFTPPPCSIAKHMNENSSFRKPLPNSHIHNESMRGGERLWV